jgi:hypothetical protein
MSAILLAGSLLAIAPAAARTYDPRYPVCIELYTIDGSTIDCAFTSMAQCAATSSGQAATKSPARRPGFSKLASTRNQS